MVEDYSTGYAAAASGILTVISLTLLVLLYIALWKMYVKAGEHGWAVLVPFYNIYVYYKLSVGNGWKMLFLLIPIFGAFYQVYVTYKLSKAFGHGFGFFLGLMSLPTIFTLIIGFGSSEYIGVE